VHAHVGEEVDARGGGDRRVSFFFRSAGFGMKYGSCYEFARWWV
jgi:hypothetical protein